MLFIAFPSSLSRSVILIIFTVIFGIMHRARVVHTKRTSSPPTPTQAVPEVPPDPRDFIGNYLVIQHRSIYVKGNKRVPAASIDQCVTILERQKLNAGYFSGGYCYIVKTKPWDLQLLRIKYGRYIVRWAAMKYYLPYYLKHSKYLYDIDTDEKTLNFFKPCDITFYDWNNSQKVKCIELPIDKTANAVFRADRNPNPGDCIFDCPPEPTSTHKP